MQKTEQKEYARLHRAYSSRWKRGGNQRRNMALKHFDIEGETERLLAKWRSAGEIQ